MREELVVRRMGDLVVMSLHGACGSSVLGQLEVKCREEILRRTKHILLDCQYVTSLHPTALKTLLSKTSEAEKAGINLVLYQVHPDQAREIQDSGLDAVLHIKKDFQDAYLHCKAKEAAGRAVL
ncbi:STAS domain-containing protein [Pontibacter kalidii]|uniref:STAS domain-containing protein n=1 Tax=Pontibacter kalidii TaxID=2592049 RepID=UPI00225ADE93|nr:STAS domain-containing protein [Pontibacter kalidii]